jgi:riboflavin kinase/FMN adenylyltransferase
MRVIRHLAALPERLPRVVLTLGNFDGVHRGHQAIVGAARERAAARDGQVVVLTFHPHPVAVLAPGRAPARMQSLHDRLACLRAFGVDVTVVQRFTHAFASIEAEAFIEDLLLARLDLAEVVVGNHVSFGRGRRGTRPMLEAFGARHGFEVRSIGSVHAGEGVASSTALREAVACGDMARAAVLLGRPWSLRGRVVMGDRRGRTIGFPTANLHVPGGVTLPPDGVYAARARVGGERHDAVLNIGVRPTFGRLGRTVEVHLLDVVRDCYGAWMNVDFAGHLRGERRFDGIEALRAAITQDVTRARTLLRDTRDG